jgi:predicted transcriptional regulator
MSIEPQKIEAGIKAVDEGRMLSHDEVKRLFTTPE